MSERVDIHEPIFALCAALGLEPNNVAEIVFRPTDVEATLFKTDDGKKYITADGRVATETRKFLVTT